jgi:glycosyltransferase involved in cell wall biosynthesis
MAGKSTHLLTVGELLAQRFQSFGAQVTLIGNYPNLENYSTEKFKITREQIGIEADKFVVAYIGGFTLARAIIPLIEAAQYMPDVTILLAGDGPQRTNIMEILPCYPEVHYVGWIPQEQVPAFTSLADVIYYGLKTTDGNSQYSSPNTLFNAMAAGKPIITTKIGDIARIVEQEQCGVIIDNADAVSISNAVQILKSHSIYTQFSHNAQYAARSKYNWDAASEILCQLYNRILA